MISETDVVKVGEGGDNFHVQSESDEEIIRPIADSDSDSRRTRFDPQNESSDEEMM